MVHVNLFPDNAPFDLLVAPIYKSDECCPVVMDIDVEARTVSICIDESNGATIENVQNGLIVRLPVYCIPTPTGANQLLKNVDIVKTIEELLSKTVFSEDFSGNRVAMISDSMERELFGWERVNKQLITMSNEIDQVSLWEASDFFDSPGSMAIFEKYKLWNPEASFSKTVEQIQDEYNGEIGDDGNPIYLMNVEEYLHEVYEWYVDCISELVENAGLEFGEFSEDYNFLEVECHIPSELAPWVRYGGWNKEGDVVVGGNTFDEIAEQIKQLEED